MQNSEFRTRDTSLYGSQTSSVDFACETATFGAELHVCNGPRPHQWNCACKTACLLSVSMDSIPHLWICAYNTETLGTELQVSMGPRPHLWFCA